MGIAAYDVPRAPRLPAESRWPPLKGPRNDLMSMASLLWEQGFEVRCLFDAAATKAAIRRGFVEHLVDGVRAESGDVALFYFSGHGQQVSDDAADPDEEDGYDEALVPYDHRGTRDARGHLRDDELKVLSKKVLAKTPHLVVIVDSCHSGTITRGRAGRGGQPPIGPPRIRTRGGGREEVGDYGGGAVVMAAARAGELAREYEDPETGLHYGAYTYLLVDELRAAARKHRVASLTYGELLDGVSSRLSGLDARQHPTFEGKARQAVFGGRLLDAPVTLRVGPLNERGMARLEGGLLQGVLQGSVFALISKDEDPRRLERARLKAAPKLQVGRVEPGHALGKLVEQDSPDGPWKSASDAAVKAAEPILAKGAAALVYQLPEGVVQKVRAEVVSEEIATELKDEVFLEVSRDADWVFRVHRWKDDVLVAPDGTPVPSGAVVIETRDEELVGIPRGPGELPVYHLSATEPGLAKRIAAALVARERKRRLLDLEPLEGEDGLDVSFSVVPLGQRLSDDGSACVETKDAVTKLERAKDWQIKQGRCFRIDVTNHEEAPVYVAILRVDPDLSIETFYPYGEVPGSSIPPKTTVSLPPTFITQAPAGRTEFKLFADMAKQPNLSILNFTPSAPTTRGGGDAGARSGFERMLGRRAGDTRGPVTPPGRWGAAQVPMEVRAD